MMGFSNVLFLVCASSLLVILRAESRRHLKIGLILPFDNASSGYEFTAQKLMPALQIALERVNQMNLLPGYEVIAIVKDSKCSVTFAPLAAMDMHYKNMADVFMGLVCDYALAPVARYAPYWNTPVITLGGSVNAFDDKSNEFKHLTRMTSPYRRAAEFVRAVLSQWEWKTASLVYYKRSGALISDGCFHKMGALYRELREIHTGYRVWHKQIDANRGEKIGDVLRGATSHSRIIIMCAEPDAIREIMLKAADMDFTNGDYVFLNFDLSSSANEIERSWYKVNDTVETNNKVKVAYEALMTLTRRAVVSLDWHAFSREVKRRTVGAHDMRYEGEVSHYAGALHDAVLLYALALNDTLAAGYNTTNTQEVTNRMWNRRFQGVTGSVVIDANGDREGDYSLLDLNPNTGKFEVVANYFGSRKQYEPVPGRTIHWPANRVAPNDSPIRADSSNSD